MIHTRFHADLHTKLRTPTRIIGTCVCILESVRDGAKEREMVCITVPMNVTIIDSAVKTLDLLNLHVISAHDGEMDIIPVPSSHLAGQWYDLRSTSQVRRSEEDISVEIILTAQSCNGMQRRSQLVKLDGSIMIMFLRLGWRCRPFWFLGWRICRSFGELRTMVGIEPWIEIS